MCQLFGTKFSLAPNWWTYWKQTCERRINPLIRQGTRRSHSASTLRAYGSSETVKTQYVLHRDNAFQFADIGTTYYRKRI